MQLVNIMMVDVMAFDKMTCYCSVIVLVVCLPRLAFDSVFVALDAITFCVVFVVE